MGMFFIYTLKVAVCLIAFYLIYKLLLSRETFHRFNRFAIIGVVTISLVIPWLKITVDNPSGMNESVTNIENFIVESTIVPKEESNPITTAQIFFFIYLIGVITFILREIVSIIKLWMLIRKGTVKELRNDVKLIVMESDIAPFSWFNYIIISEKDYYNNPDEIITHELAHVAHKHSVDVALCNLLIIIQWFNPAAWLLKIELQNVHEFEADEAVINNGVDAQRYQMLLIRKAVGERLFSLANNLNHNSLKKRITMMTCKKSNPWNRAKYLLAIPVAAIAVVAFASPKVENISTEIEMESTNAVPAMLDNIKSESNFQTTKKTKKKLHFTPPTIIKDADYKIVLPLKTITVNGVTKKIAQPITRKTINGKTVETVRINGKNMILRTKTVNGKKVRTVRMNGRNVEVVFEKPKSEPVEDNYKYSDDNIFTVAEQMPSYPGGQEALFDYLSKNIHYPKVAESNGIQGRVIVTFVVRKDGSITDTHVVSSVDPALDAEAVRVIKMSKPWIPGMQRGKAVNVKFTVPVTFRLQ